MYIVLLCIHCKNNCLLVNREDQFSTQQRKGVRERGMIEREREVNRSYHTTKGRAAHQNSQDEMKVSVQGGSQHTVTTLPWEAAGGEVGCQTAVP